MVVSLTGSLFVVCRPVVDICGVDFATIGDTVTMIGKVVVLLVIGKVDVVVIVVVVVVVLLVNVKLLVVVEVVIVVVVVVVIKVVVEMVVEVLLIVGGVEMVLDGIVNKFGSVIFSVNSVGFIS